MLTQQQAKTAFWVIQGLPPNSQISIDGHTTAFVTNDQFQGIKLLPKGWHALTWNVESGVKNLLLRWFDEGEVVIRKFNQCQEQIVLHSSASSSISRKVARQVNPTVVSQEYLESINSQLMPYPQDAQDKWKRATKWLSRKVIARVVGVQAESGDAVVDSMTTGPCDEEVDQAASSGRPENGKRIWGKSRPPQEDLERFQVLSSDDEDQPSTPNKRKHSKEPPSEEQDDHLAFTLFNLKRSWPPGAVGTDLTRYSIDKSYLLSSLLSHPLLAELELAFVIFLSSHNHYCLEHWKSIISLFCRSSSFIGATSQYDPHPSSASPQDGSKANLGPHTDFLMSFKAQLNLLPEDFWSEQQQPKEEEGLLRELDVLRGNMARSLALLAVQQREEKESQGLVNAWRQLSHMTKDKFGWDLDKRLDEEAEVLGDLEAEEGEDAPLVVEF